MSGRCLIVLLGCLAVAGAAEDRPVTEQVLAELSAANQARADLAREEAAWRGERTRLQAVIAAARAEGARLEREAAAAETERAARADEMATLDAASELAAVQRILREAGERVAERLHALAGRVVPGAVDAPAAGDTDPFTAAAIALDASERRAGRVDTAVVVGDLGGQRVAARILRVAGAAAWWVSLDGVQAGTVSVDGGSVRLLPATDEPTREAIRSALAMAEGRKPSATVVLPLPAEGTP